MCLDHLVSSIEVDGVNLWCCLDGHFSNQDNMLTWTHLSELNTIIYQHRGPVHLESAVAAATIG